MSKERELAELQNMLAKYSRFGEGLITKSLRLEILRLESKNGKATDRKRWQNFLNF